jgi:hypothetical protein
MAFRRALFFSFATIGAMVLVNLIPSLGDQTGSPCPAGGCAAAEGADICFVADQGVCLWPASKDGEGRQRKQIKNHPGDPGLIGQDGKPVPDHLCVSCHDDPDLLPPDHLRTTGISMDGCRICHGTDAAAPLDDRIFQSHRHFFADVTCADCHEDPTDPEEPDMAICTGCHGTLDELAAKTAHVEHANPHSSPHGAPYAVCSLCHYQHEEQDVFCASCHDFEFSLP